MLSGAARSARPAYLESLQPQGGAAGDALNYFCEPHRPPSARQEPLGAHGAFKHEGIWPFLRLLLAREDSHAAAWEGSWRWAALQDFVAFLTYWRFGRHRSFSARLYR